MARDPRQDSRGAKAIRRSGRMVAHPAHLCVTADRRDLPKRNVEDVSHRDDRAGADGKGNRVEDRLSRLEQSHLGVRPRDLPLQSLRLDGDAALPLALLLLSESLPWADR